jgi:hypothetical protein
VPWLHQRKAAKDYHGPDYVERLYTLHEIALRFFCKYMILNNKINWIGSCLFLEYIFFSVPLSCPSTAACATMPSLASAIDGSMPLATTGHPQQFT